MKKPLVLSCLGILLLSSCATQKATNYTDDVYSNPKEDRIEEARLAAIAKQEQEARDRRYNDSIVAINKAQKDKDDANPYYKDREFKYDDYYDYEYATRIKRFDNRINGLSYYDNYYTNSYWYSGNPYNYGISVYNGYSWWGPSYNNYSYNPSVAFYSNWGWGYGGGYGYNGYNPYYNSFGSSYWQGYYNGYNQGYNNGWYGYPYSGYGYGSPYYGYNNPYNNGWGYYNGYDVNSGYSVTYGPRSSHGGGNSHRTTNPGMRDDGYYHKLATDIKNQQDQEVKFADITPRGNTYNNPNAGNNGHNGTGGIKTSPNTNGGNGNTTPIRNNYPINNNPIIDQPTKSEPVKNHHDYNTGGVKSPTYQEPVKQNPIHNIETRPVKEMATPNFPSNNNYNNNNGGGNVPANSGGHRPR